MGNEDDYVSDSNDTAALHHGTMHCTDDYSSSCNIDPDALEWQCDPDTNDNTNDHLNCDSNRQGADQGEADTLSQSDDNHIRTGFTAISIGTDSEFWIVMVIAVILMLTICYMKHLMNRKPPRVDTIKLNVNRKSSTTSNTLRSLPDHEPSEEEDSEQFSGMIIYEPEAEESLSVSDHLRLYSGHPGHGHNITATPSHLGDLYHVINDSDDNPDTPRN